MRKVRTHSVYRRNLISCPTMWKFRRTTNCGKITLAEKDQRYHLFEDFVIKPFYELGKKCLEAMEQQGFDAKKNQKEQITIWRSSETCHITRSKDLLALIEIFSGKVQMPPPKLQVCLKYIVNRSTA